MKVKETIGIDISKSTFDVYAHQAGKSHEFANDKKGFDAFEKWVGRIVAEQPEAILICFEHTGLYSMALAKYLSGQGRRFSMVSALAIKKSMGIVRGKSDPVDARRIAEFAYLRRHSLTQTVLTSETLEKLGHLLQLRGRLVKQRAGYQTSQREYARLLTKKHHKDLFASHAQMIRTLNQEIKRMEAAMLALIDGDQQIQQLYKLVTSVKGVGFVLGCHFLVHTHGFTRFANSRKFACYSGIAPFAYQSGSSIKHRSRVSNYANKDIKTLLTIAAWSAVQHDAELKQYYHRRLDIGKSRMSTINIVRNKLVSRVFAVVKRGTPYVQLQKHAA